MGYGLSHSAGGAELGTLMGLGADLAPAAARVALGNAMRIDAVNDYLKTGVLPQFYTGAAQAAPPALAAAKSAVTAPQPLLARP